MSTCPVTTTLQAVSAIRWYLDALGWAFAAASQRHLPLDVVTAWDPAVLATHRLEDTVANEVLAATGNHHLETAQEAVAPWQEKYPDVTVHLHVTTDAPAETLIERSDGAALTVVGSRGLGSVRGLLLGSVSGAVLQQALSLTRRPLKSYQHRPDPP